MVDGSSDENEASTLARLDDLLKAGYIALPIKIKFRDDLKEIGIERLCEMYKNRSAFENFLRAHHRNRDLPYRTSIARFANGRTAIDKAVNTAWKAYRASQHAAGIASGASSGDVSRIDAYLNPFKAAEARAKSRGNTPKFGTYASFSEPQD